MARTNRFITMLSLVAAGLVFSSALAVEPGESVDLKNTAAVSPCLTDIFIDPNAPSGSEADASCDEVEGTMQARAVLDELVETQLGATASAAVLYEFDVDANPGTEGNMVEGALTYGISWRGFTDLVGSVTDAEYTVSITLAVEDITGIGLPVTVASVDIHKRNSGSGVDEGITQDRLAMILVRGNSYRVTATLEVLAISVATADPTSVVADYFSEFGIGSEPGGASVDVLDLQVGFDIAELAAQVEANTEAIAENTEAIEDNTAAIEANAEAIAALAEALADLVEVVANHTHTYLTGRGQGHNNTEATTTPPTADEPSPEMRYRGRSSKVRR